MNAASLMLLGALLVSSTVSAQGTGALVGRVLDPNGNPMPGAEVVVEGTNLTTSTNVSGSFRLSSVPAGSHTLRVAYLGYQPASESIDITAGATATYDVTLEPYGEEVTVRASPLLSGQAKALNQQKNAVNIMNIVASDQIGRFPDPNAAEATQRIPAITLQRDQGEGRYVLVRGTEARLNSMMVNGERIPSPEAGVRDIALDVIPADLLEAIEVTKALTPDMDGDAIGGSVNLVTKRAPEQRRVSLTAGYGLNDLTDDDIVNGNFAYGARFGAEKKLGWLVSGSSLDTRRGSDNFEVSYDDGFLEELEFRDYTIRRERVGFTSDLDYRLSEQDDLYVRGIWNEYTDSEIRRLKLEAPGDDAIERETRDRIQASKIISLVGGGNHLIGSKFLIEWRGVVSAAEENTPDRYFSVSVQEDVEFAPNVTPDSIDPDNIRSNPLNEDFNAFVLDGLELEQNLGDEDDILGAVDVSIPFYRDAGLSGLWKFGAKARFKEKNEDNNLFEYDLEDDILLSELADDWRSETPFFNGRYDIGRFPSTSVLRGLPGALGLDLERDPEEDLADYTTEEDTVAVYGMVDLQLGPSLTFVGGVRYEQTDTNSAGLELLFDEEGDFVGFTPVLGDSDYDFILPMVHLRYALDDSSNFRAAVTRSLARPNYEDLAPFVLIIEEDSEIERGNPLLDPTSAWNLDVMYERYYEPAGLFSAGVFYKRLDDNVFIFTFDEERNGETFDVTQARNGERAEILGFETAYQNRLRGLPAPWDGLGIFFNLTLTDSEADLPDRPGARLQGQADQITNFALSYEKGGFSGRLSWNYHSEYILEAASDALEDVFIDDHLQLDFSAWQQISDRWSIGLELINLTDEPYRVYEGSADRPIQEEVYSWWGTLRVKYDF